MGSLRPAALALAVVTAAAVCAPPAALREPSRTSPPIEAASPAAVALPTATAPAQKPGASPAPPRKSPHPEVPMPAVAADVAGVVFGPTGALREDPAGADEETLRELDGWLSQLVTVMNRVGRDPSRGPQDERLAGYASGPYRDVLVAWLYQRARVPGPIGALTADGLTLHEVYRKPWGTIAHAEVTMAYVDGVAADLAERTRHETRVRVARLRPFTWVAFDAYDVATSSWLAEGSSAPSGMALAVEAVDGVGRFLWAESHEQGAMRGYFQTPLAGPYASYRDRAFAALSAHIDAGLLEGRRFEDVRAVVTRFDPVGERGEGIVEVTVRATLVEVRDGVTIKEDFSRSIRFLRRVFSEPVASWIPIDETRPDGTWASGGDLALAEYDRAFG